MKKLLFILSVVLVAGGISVVYMHHTASAALKTDDQSGAIKWYTLAEAQKLDDQSPRKIFLEIHTSWCGWCKKMDAETFDNPVIAKYMNEHFYCVQFDAETHDTVVFNGQKFWNRSNAPRSVNDFAIVVLQGHLSYPSYAFISKNRKLFTIMQGYYPAEQFEPYIHYYGDEHDSTLTFQDFMKTFKSQLPPPTPQQQQQEKQAPQPH